MAQGPMATPARTAASPFVFTPIDEAHGRAGAYALLAELLARGVDDRTQRAAQTSPILARALRREPALEADELASDHQHVFGFEVFPFEGVYLDPEGRVGGRSSAALFDLYRRIGFVPDTRSEEPEHLATMLRALAHASGNEAAALHAGEYSREVGHARALARELLDAHLLQWLPTFAAAVRRVGRPFPAALVDQIEQLALLHRERLGEPAPVRHELTGDPLQLADDVGLADLARALTVSARAGLFLSRSDIARIGRSTRVPRGFGARPLLMNNLLRTASDLGQLPDVLDGLCTLLAEARIALAQHREQAPWLDPLVAPHRERMSCTSKALGTLSARARRAAAPGAAPSP